MGESTVSAVNPLPPKHPASYSRITIKEKRERSDVVRIIERVVKPKCTVYGVKRLETCAEREERQLQ